MTETELATHPTWDAAVQSAINAGNQAVGVVIMGTIEANCTATTADCIKLLAAQRFLKVTMTHYDVFDRTRSRITCDGELRSVGFELANVALAMIRKNLRNDPEMVNMAALQAAIGLMESVQGNSVCFTQISAAIESAIACKTPSLLMQKCILAATAQRLIDIWINRMGSRMCMSIVTEYDRNTANLSREAAQLALTSIRIPEIESDLLSTAISLTRGLSPAYA